VDELRQAFDVLEDALHRISRKEAVLSRQMRMMADQADELMSEVGHLKTVLTQLPLAQMAKSAQSLETQSEPLPIPEPTPLIPEPVQQILEESIPSDGPMIEPVISEESVKPQHEAAVPTISYSTKESQPKDIGRFELDLGIKWLSRIGIVALLIGIAMALSYSFPNFSKEMKLVTGFFVAFGLFWGGGRLHATSSILGRILQGGGLSVGYLTLFAMFFIPEVQVFHSTAIGLIGLFIYVAFVLTLAHRMNSQTVALLSLAFGYYTAGYSESHVSAFLTTGILSLGTVGVTRLHQDWKILPKANLLGALLTYLIWYNRDGLHGDWSARLYLVFTYSLFHIVSLLRGKAGDVYLNQVNSFAFYGCYTLSQPLIGAPGLLEFMIATVQAGSWLLFTALHPEERQSGFAQGLIILTLLFLGFGTLKYFDGMTLSAILAAEALCLGYLSLKGQYRPLLVTASYLFYIIAFFQTLIHWQSQSDLQILLNGFWVSIVGLLLESKAYRSHELGVRAVLLGACSLLLVSAINQGLPHEWRTITLAATGFTLLTSGFLCKRKLYRWMGLGWVFGIAGLSMLGDMVSLSMGYKILLFILLGAGLLGGSYGYSVLARRL
jgi:hypothetical protein